MKLPRPKSGFALLVLMLFLVGFAALPGCDLGYFGDFSDEELLASGDQLVIAYAEAPESFSPLSYEAAERKYLLDIYEALVRHDNSFNHDSSLAVSWGRLDDYTWDFKLRQEVIFHDGSEFDANDARYSINLALEHTDSELKSLLSTIEEVKVTEEHRLEIVTLEPDPLLLDKLTYVFMVPEDYWDFDTPMGTGPYYPVSYESSEDGADFTLARFDGYWGAAPFFDEAVLTYIPGAEERLEAMLAGEVDFLANVPPQYVEDFEEAGIGVSGFPSLEVSFLMLNMDSAFGDLGLRGAVYHALADDYAEVLGSGYLMATSQYAAMGIAGFSPKIPDRQQNVEQAEVFLSDYSGTTQLFVDLPVGLEALGEKLQEDFEAVGLELFVEMHEADEYEDYVLSGDSDAYFFGWKYDLADVMDFYNAVAHSRGDDFGSFNVIAYSEDDVDVLIEEVNSVFDEVERGVLISDITRLLTGDKAIIPLFESKVLYGISPDLTWPTRLDGQILASEIVSFMVD
jgi:peptide/nickel transport system substrate-binding protein